MSQKGTKQRHRCRGCGRMILRYQDGASTLAISAEIGRIAPATIIAYLRHHGVTIRPPGRRVSSDLVPPVLSAYRDGKTAAEIGREHGISRERVRQIIVAACGVYVLPRVHRCTAACRVVLAHQDPLELNVLSQSVAISSARLARAAKIHGVITSGRMRHRCGDACARLYAVLANSSPASIHAAGVTAGIPRSSIYQRYRAYHPEWPWPKKRWHSSMTEEDVR